MICILITLFYFDFDFEVDTLTVMSIFGWKYFVRAFTACAYFSFVCPVNLAKYPELVDHNNEATMPPFFDPL